MKTLRRYYKSDTPYFVTVVTHKREPLLLQDLDLFWYSWQEQKLMSWVILSDHFHAILQPARGTISHVMHQFKITYSRNFRDRYRPGPVWQNRFWDHMIRDQVDLNKHIDYVHYNPVKHNLVTAPGLYAFSSFEQFVKEGYYSPNWGIKPIEFEREFGE